MKILGKAKVVNGPRVLEGAAIPELESSAAPVAARLEASPEYPGSGAEEVIDLRVHDGRFYSRVPQTIFDGTTMDFDIQWGTPSEVERYVRNGLAGLLVIDGTLWEPTAEPALIVARNGSQLYLAHSDGPFSRPWLPFTAPHSFKLTSLEDALAEARRRKGDSAVQVPFLEVLVPEAFKVRPAA